MQLDKQETLEDKKLEKYLELLYDDKVELKKALRASYLKALEREKRARDGES